MFSSQLKKGNVEVLVLAILEHEDHHGYQIGKLIEIRSGGSLQFRISSLYPVLCRLEGRGWVRGRWVEAAGERRRRFYRLTKRGTAALASERKTWRDFTMAVDLVLGESHG